MTQYEPNHVGAHANLASVLVGQRKFEEAVAEYNEALRLDANLLEAHLGIAVALEDGLVVPVIRQAHTKSVRQISKEIKQLADLGRMRQRLDEMLASLRSGDVATATSAGADFSTIMISASGNRELQTHVDLVVTRMRRLLGLTPQSNHWRPWIDGYTEVLVLLEHGDAQAAMARYRRIYAEVRADLESGEAAAQGLEAACPDPLR